MHAAALLLALLLVALVLAHPAAATSQGSSLGLLRGAGGVGVAPMTDPRNETAPLPPPAPQPLPPSLMEGAFPPDFAFGVSTSSYQIEGAECLGVCILAPID